MNRQDAKARFADIHALIAEDDGLIALDMEQTLCAHFGFRATVVHSVPQGLAFLSEGMPHVAVLDLDLGGESIEPIARALTEIGVPMLFVSGYRSHPLDDLTTSLKLEKPYSSEELIDMMTRTLARLEG
jgi:ActR/RegA family two-component response regulator